MPIPSCSLVLLSNRCPYATQVYSDYLFALSIQMDTVTCGGGWANYMFIGLVVSFARLLIVVCY